MVPKWITRTQSQNPKRTSKGTYRSGKSFSVVIYSQNYQLKKQQYQCFAGSTYKINYELRHEGKFWSSDFEAWALGDLVLFAFIPLEFVTFSFLPVENVFIYRAEKCI